MGMKERGGKLTRGIGINDMDYDVFKRLPDGKVWHCPIYRYWANMLTRVQHKERKYSYDYDVNFGSSYNDVSVDPSWLIFSNFHKWVSSQDYEGKSLDKDILGDGTLYSEGTCCFVPNSINTLIHGKKTRRKGVSHDYMAGTSYVGTSWYWTINWSGSKYAHGKANSEIEAHQCWQFHKSKLIRKVSDESFNRGEISELVRDALHKKADKIDQERQEGKQTIRI